MMGRSTTSIWLGSDARGTGCGFEKHFACRPALPRLGYATSVTRRPPLFSKGLRDCILRALRESNFDYNLGLGPAGVV